MIGQANPNALPTVILFFSAGGLLLVSFGLVMTVWGLINLFRAKGPLAVYSQMVVSFLPALIALFAIYSAYGDFAAMAASPRPPKPAEFAAISTRGMAYGFYGILATIVPLALGLFTAWRLQWRRAIQSTAE